MLLLCALVAGAAYAKDLPPLEFRDKGKKYIPKFREFSFRDYTDIRMSNTVPCKIRYLDPYFGYLDDDAYYRAGKMPIQSACYNANNEDLSNHHPVSFDKESGTWVRDIERYLMATRGEITGKDYVKLKYSLHFYPLKAINSIGFAYTLDDLEQAKPFRTRNLSYCLFRGNIGLCGVAPELGLLKDGERGDLTPYVLQLLRSIEFLDERPSPSAQPPSEPKATAAGYP